MPEQLLSLVCSSPENDGWCQITDPAVAAQAGLAPTRQLIQMARAHGCTNVHDYLVLNMLGEPCRLPSGLSAGRTPCPCADAGSDTA